VRIVERAKPVGDGYRPERQRDALAIDPGLGFMSGTPGYIAEFNTVGWSDCGCPEPDYQPGLVLDPFCGIGTTGLVARRLGRRFVGIELSPKYAAMAREKMRTWWRKTNLSEPDVPEAQAVLPLEAAP